MTEQLAPAIPRRIDGIQFRSGTEVRWWKMFRGLELEPRYEPDLIRLPLVNYLPDFYLPTIGRLIEVKGSVAQIGDDQQIKFDQISQYMPTISDSDRALIGGGPLYRRDQILWVVGNPWATQATKKRLQLDYLILDAAGVRYALAICPCKQVLIRPYDNSQYKCRICKATTYGGFDRHPLPSLYTKLRQYDLSAAEKRDRDVVRKKAAVDRTTRVGTKRYGSRKVRSV